MSKVTESPTKVHNKKGFTTDDFIFYELETISENILNTLLDLLEKKESQGYRDSIIDLGTNLELARMALHKYVDMTSRKWNTKPEHEYNETEINKLNKGGYDKEEFERIVEILSK